MSTSIDAYRSVNLNTATPRQVLVKTLAAGARFLTEAEEAIAASQDAAPPLAKARTIVSGLMTSLDFEAGDMAHQLLRLYLFVLDRVQSSGASGEDEGLADARKVLETLQSAWEEMPAEDARRGMESRRAVGLSLKG